MHMGFFGDSYDIVKQSIIAWLRNFGDWSVHPMLTKEATEQQIGAFQIFLGAPVICSEVLTKNTNREQYLKCGEVCGNLFLDPDTGICLHQQHRRSPNYLFGGELVRLSERRPQALTLVFDQSLARGGERQATETKLRKLRDQGFHGFAYLSHACFIIGGHNEALVRRSFSDLLARSRLPQNRFILAEE